LPSHTDKNGKEKISISCFECSEHGQFIESLQQRLETARKIVMMGSGVAALGHPTLVEKLMMRAAKRQCSVEVYIANPYAPAVEARLVEEELGGMKPPDGKQGLLARLSMLVRCWRQYGSPKSVKICVTTQYPTFALLILDEEYSIYPYAYAQLGNFSPVLTFTSKDSQHRRIIKFLTSHEERVRSAAYDAKLILEEKILKKSNLCGLAVFVIPPAESVLYRFGSKILGYDIRHGKRIKSIWSHFAGRATNYGFHLTVGDALYFANKAEVEKATIEVKYILAEMRRFQVSDLEFCPEFPNSTSVALKVTDSSGSLEALHHEFVHRLYRRALASEYTFNANLADRSGRGERSTLMMTRYKAPYILKEYIPHFTLLSDLPGTGFAEKARDLRVQFESEVSIKNRNFTVDEVALTTWNQIKGVWEIQDEIELRR
jgi:hypothetical protein